MTEAVVKEIARGLVEAREKYAEEFPLLAFPTKSGEFWLLHESGFEELCEAFPYMTPARLGDELRRAFAWVASNKSKRKTERGMMRFLVNWIARSRRDQPEGRLL